MATTIPRPQGTRSGGSSLQAPRKTSLIARPSTPSRLSTVGPPGASLPTSKSLQKSVSVSSFSHQTKGSRTSLSPPTPLKLNRRLSTIGKTNPAPPSQHRDSDGDYKEIKRLSRKSTSNLSASTSSDDAGRLSVLPSPPPSRSGSAEGSYTSVTAINGSHSDSVAMRGGGGEGGGKEKEGKGNVVVSVRCRPDGDGSNGDNFWVVDPRGSRIVYKGGEGGDYIYDNVFGPNDDNSRVYDACAKRLVRRVMEGYHGTVFAYGMTGTGKTFSMQGTTTSPGVIPLAINDIFSFIRETPNREFLLRVSYLEIYNERIHDLLSAATPTGKNGMPEAPQEEIKLREDAKRGVYATPLKEEIVQSPTQLLRVIARGDMARRVAGTQFNARSSRSHAVVQVVVESRDRVPGGNPMGGKGSGVCAATAGGGHINRSLLTLGTVIARLSETKGKEKDKDGSHLPYRDSKLTRLLQPALSGNSLVSILCTIATGTQSATNETLNTLKFAARARNNIVSHAKKADDGPLGGVDAGSRVLLERYRLEIERLRAQLDEVAKQKEETEEREREEKERERHEEQMLEMQLARTALKERIEHLNRLILCSKSSGVNSARNSTATSHPGHMSSISTRSSLNLVGLSRAFSTSSAGSPVLPGSHHLSLTSEVSYHQPPMEFQEDEDSTGGEFGDGIATLSAQVKALQADVADKKPIYCHPGTETVAREAKLTQ
ncbi:P-loop containing nucleoside triphosphate hydrolase protein [Kalaharituber pfeilii]|nr:P-loop containing nucleoside triphosphate hydrolase protein [Kalaharituber pfeilii]